jgi:hypothetical protein
VEGVFAHGGTGDEGVAAGAGHVQVFVIRMDASFHGFSFGSRAQGVCLRYFAETGIMRHTQILDKPRAMPVWASRLVMVRRKIDATGAH